MKEDEENTFENGNDSSLSFHYKEFRKYSFLLKTIVILRATLKSSVRRNGKREDTIKGFINTFKNRTILMGKLEMSQHSVLNSFPSFIIKVIFNNYCRGQVRFSVENAMNKSGIPGIIAKNSLHNNFEEVIISSNLIVGALSAGVPRVSTVKYVLFDNSTRG